MCVRQRLAYSVVHFCSNVRVFRRFLRNCSANVMLTQSACSFRTLACSWPCHFCEATPTCAGSSCRANTKKGGHGTHNVRTDVQSTVHN